MHSLVDGEDNELIHYGSSPKPNPAARAHKSSYFCVDFPGEKGISGRRIYLFGLVSTRHTWIYDGQYKVRRNQVCNSSIIPVTLHLQCLLAYYVVSLSNTGVVPQLPVYIGDFTCGHTPPYTFHST